MWFNVVCTLIDNDTRHHMVKMLWTNEAAETMNTKKTFGKRAMTRTINDKENVFFRARAKKRHCTTH